MSETTQRRSGEADVAPGAAPDFAAVFRASPAPMLLLAADPPRFTMIAVNAAHASAFRTTPEALEGFGLFEVFGDPPPPEAAGFVETVRASLDRVMSRRKADDMPIQAYAVVGADGQSEERYWSATQTPVVDAQGRLTHIVSTVRDVTSQVTERRVNEARALLMREVDHRARNALTVVQSILRLTEADDTATFREVVQGRVEALARAQTSLARRKWEGAWLREVIEAELGALASPGAYSVEGPPTLIPAEQVQALGMILHELATNARKYGALGAASGRVHIAWRREGERLALVWTETGGPSVAPPSRHGFGSKLVARLAGQLKGSVAYSWPPDGLSFELKALL